MNTKISAFLSSVFFAFLVLSCATPAYIVKLLPDKEPDKWMNGQALVFDSVYGISYEIGFDRQSGDGYIFDFQIENHSNMPFLVDPARFYYLPLDATMNPMIPEKITALDPEKRIFEIEKHLSINQARSKNQLGYTLMALGADIATTVIVASDDNENNDFVQRAAADGVHFGLAASGVANEYETIELNELRESWATSTIRKTTLDRNYAMHGKVLFPASPGASYIQIHLPVDDKWLRFTFMQVKVSAQE